MLVLLFGLTAFLAAGAASFDGRQLDPATFSLFCGGISYGVCRAGGGSQPHSVDVGFVGTWGGAVYAVLTRHGSGVVIVLTLFASVFAAVGFVLVRITRKFGLGTFLTQGRAPFSARTGRALALLRRLRAIGRVDAPACVEPEAQRCAARGDDGAETGATARVESKAQPHMERLLCDVEHRCRDVVRKQNWRTAVVAGVTAALVTSLLGGRRR